MKSTRCSLTLLFVSLLAVTAQAANISWDAGGGANLNWSTVANWSDDAAPSGDTVTFNEVGGAGAAGVVTNVVDASYSVGSFFMTNTPGNATGNFHTTQITGGNTLTITGNYEQGVGPCGTSNACAGDSTNMTFTGAGSLNFNNGTTGRFEVGQWAGYFDRGVRQVTLDMAQLANFTMNASVWEIGRVGAAIPATVMTLADTNNITAATLDIAEWNDTAILELGRVNDLKIDTFQLSYLSNNSARATVRFDAGLINPSVKIRNRAGNGGATLNMSENNGGAGDNPAVLDLTGGDVDAWFSNITMSLGRPNQHAGDAIATISFNQGTMLANSVLMGHVRDFGNATPTINVNGTATFDAGMITMLNVSNVVVDAKTGLGTARINLGGGTLRATLIQPGTDLGEVVRPHVREIRLTSGTIANRVGTDLTISQGIDINLNSTGFNNKFFDVEASQTATVDAAILGAGGFTKIGAGTLLLNGSNTYTGTTQVNAGTVGGNGAASSDFVFASGSTLSPGTNGPGTFLTDDATLQSGSTFFVQLGGLTAGTEYDQLLAAGDVIIGGNLVIEIIDGFIPSVSDVFAIVNADSVQGTFSSVSLLNAPGYFEVVYTGTQVLLTNYSVPEPATLHLLGLAGLVLVAKRRRKRGC